MEDPVIIDERFAVNLVNTLTNYYLIINRREIRIM